MMRSLPIVAGAGAPRRQVRHARRILLVFPRYVPSFGTFQHAYHLLPGVRAFMPPQGILVIAAMLPSAWQVRFVDENIRDLCDDDLQWADAVLVSGMHVQRRRIEAINQLAHRHGKLTVLGGPSVSACPQYYPDFDILHLGESGDATDELLALLDESVQRPSRQIVLRTRQRLPLEQFPCPAYHLLDLRRYFLGSVQFSSGCPFLCEFCDIPALYGRNPRTKTPQQVVRELDCLLAGGLRSAVYFVDDNFIANPAAARQLLPHLIDWQHRSGYPLRLCCEATLNLAQAPDILAMMRQAQFHTVFVGIETPQPDALALMHKKQNMRQPILQAVRTLNDHGMEVVSGIIMGLDSDTPDTADHLLRFIEDSQIPMLTINLLYALPGTALHERLAAAGRLTDDPVQPSNVIFKLPQNQVLAMWAQVIRQAYEPAALLRRYEAQTRRCYPNRLKVTRRIDAGTLGHGLGVIARTLWHVGWRSDYRREFWRLAWPLLRQGRVEDLMHIGIVSHHLIRFARQCLTGVREPSFYADPNRAAADPTGPRVQPAANRVEVEVSEEQSPAAPR